ncbi:MAG: T9SS type A sorting domain-containing protein [candidate division WOR-3 bacterium]
MYWEEVNVGATNIIQSNKITGWRDPNDPNAGSLYGIYLTKNPTASIPTVMMFANNSISNFSQGGICIQGSFPIEITGKGTIFNNTYYGIYSTLNSRPKIRWTEINFNKAGVYADYYSYPDLGTINDSGYNQILLGNYYWVVNHNPEPQEPIYAQCNWWGTAEPDTLPWKFIGWVIYYPWLTSPPWEEEFTSSQVSNLNKITSPVLNISPNIIKDKLNIKYFLPKEEEVSLILYDNNGRKVKLIDKGKKDKNEISLLTKDLNNGLYFLILRGKDFNLKRKLIILK